MIAVMGDALFQCPTCEAAYKVVRIEAPPSHDRQLLCLGCCGPLRSREGKYALKYFRVQDTARMARLRGRPEGQRFMVREPPKSRAIPDDTRWRDD